MDYHAALPPAQSKLIGTVGSSWPFRITQLKKCRVACSLEYESVMTMFPYLVVTLQHSDRALEERIAEGGVSDIGRIVEYISVRASLDIPHGRPSQ